MQVWLIWLLVIFCGAVKDLGDDDSKSSHFESDLEQDQTLDLPSAPTDNKYEN